MKRYKDFMDYTREEWNTNFFYKAKRLFVCQLGFTILALVFYYTGLMLPAYLMFMLGMVFAGAAILATAFWYLEQYIKFLARGKSNEDK